MAENTPRADMEVLDRALFDGLIERARQSPRRRINHNFHVSLEDNPHRFLNVMLRGTYITPHRHQFPPKAETFLLLEGRLAFVLFHDDGSVREQRILQAGNGRIPLGVDILPGLWHTLLVLSDHAVCFEVKPGPYRLADDKEFAPWAPREGSASAEDCAAYVTRLEAELALEAH